MDTELLKETIKKELPGLLRDDPACVPIFWN